MISFVLSTFGVIWLMFVIRFLLTRSERSEVKTKKPIERSGPWIEGDCECGTKRDNWQIIAVNNYDYKLLLLCPNCTTFWEEKMGIGKHRSRRKVDEKYAQYVYSFNKDKLEVMSTQ